MKYIIFNLVLVVINLITYIRNSEFPVLAIFLLDFQ